MCSDSFLSWSGSGLSSNKNIKSNLDNIAFEIFVFYLKDFPLLQQPYTGLAEANIPTLHFN